MKLEVTFSKGGLPTVVTLNPTESSIKQAAKKIGYQAKVQDATISRQIELKQSELLALEPTDTARIALRNEINQLQQAAQELIDNPVGAEEFVVAAVKEILLGLLIDEQAIQQEAQQLHEQRIADQRAAALAALGLPEAVEG